MRKMITFALLTLIFATSVRGQVEKSATLALQEEVHVRLNNTVFLTGEYLFYKAFVLDTIKKSFSNKSDLMYVELIGADLNVLFKHKLSLEEGQGHSDFFIPNTVTSGTYKLIAYTPRTIAGNTPNFFQKDIGIINPYRAAQDQVLANSQAKPKQNGPAERLSKGAHDKSRRQFNMLELHTDSVSYGTRAKVSVQIKNNSNELGFGTYVLSVHKQSVMSGPFQDHEQKSDDAHTSVAPTENIDVTMVPNGTVVQGFLQSTKPDVSVSGVDVALSVPGTHFIFKVATTNAHGVFRFILDAELQDETALLQVLGSDPEYFNIVTEPEKGMAYTDIAFETFHITAAVADELVQRSIYNQIENAYYGVKPDTIQAAVPSRSFVHYEERLTYNLDDYERFSTLDEVFTEYAKYVWTSRDEAGEKVVKVFQRDYNEHSGNLPLLFIDGVLVANHTDFLNVDARTITTLSIIQREYRFGGTDYQGVLLLETKDGLYGRTKNKELYTEIDLFSPQPKKAYYRQQYSNANHHSRIPDYRTQLAWFPSVQVNDTQTPLSFFTSDIPGSYEIRLDGFTEHGKQITIRKSFMVTE